MLGSFFSYAWHTFHGVICLFQWCSIHGYVYSYYGIELECDLLFCSVGSILAMAASTDGSASCDSKQVSKPLARSTCSIFRCHGAMDLELMHSRWRGTESRGSF